MMGDVRVDAKSAQVQKAPINSDAAELEFGGGAETATQFLGT